MIKKSNKIKIITINFLILILLLLLIEALSATIYYYKHGHPNNSLASVWAIDRTAKKIDKIIALKSLESNPKIPVELIIQPQNNIEKQFKDYLIKEYEKEFDNLANFVKTKSIPMVILWIPTRKTKEINNFFEKFFKQISEKNNLEFISMMKLIDQPSWSIFLEPYNGHLTRYANHLISEDLFKSISNNEYDIRKSFKCKKIKGVWSSKTNEIWDIITEVPYNLSTDKFGFRKTSNKEYSMEKPSILIAGDSFTFGPYLPFYDSYPSILQRKLINWNIINAGVSSFAIRSEANIIKKNLDCINPSLIILQVLDNDITGTAIAKYNRNNNFLNETLPISKVEQKYYDQKISENKLKTN